MYLQIMLIYNLYYIHFFFFTFPDKKKEKSRHTELDRLVLQKYFQADVDNLSESISSRPKRASAPPSNWWVVRPAERNSTFDVEEDLPQSSPKSKSMSPFMLKNEKSSSLICF